MQKRYFVETLQEDGKKGETLQEDGKKGERKQVKQINFLEQLTQKDEAL